MLSQVEKLFKFVVVACLAPDERCACQLGDAPQNLAQGRVVVVPHLPAEQWHAGGTDDVEQQSWQTIGQFFPLADQVEAADRENEKFECCHNK